MMGLMQQINQAAKKNLESFSDKKQIETKKSEQENIKQEIKPTSNNLSKYVITLIPCYFDLSFYGMKKLISNNLTEILAYYITWVYIAFLLLMTSLNVFQTVNLVKQDYKEIKNYKNIVLMPIINNPVFILISYLIMKKENFEKLYSDTASNKVQELYLQVKNYFGTEIKKEPQNSEVPTKA